LGKEGVMGSLRSLAREKWKPLPPLILEFEIHLVEDPNGLRNWCCFDLNSVPNDMMEIARKRLKEHHQSHPYRQVMTYHNLSEIPDDLNRAGFYKWNSDYSCWCSTFGGEYWQTVEKVKRGKS